MHALMVRYTIRNDKVAENEELIHAVFDELRATSPHGLAYRTFKLDDNASFVHLALLDANDGDNPLTALESFRRFAAKIGERCVEPPVVTDLFPLDSYGFAEATRN